LSNDPTLDELRREIDAAIAERQRAGLPYPKTSGNLVFTVEFARRVLASMAAA
jgi:hypothetical protein